MLRSYREVCAQATSRYEGHIAQYMGDGLLVYFGYPLAHEDDPQRGVHAGLPLWKRWRSSMCNSERAGT